MLIYDSESDAESAANKAAADDEEVGTRGEHVLVFSNRTGPEDRVAIEECFLDADEGNSGEGDGGEEDGGGDEEGGSWGSIHAHQRRRTSMTPPSAADPAAKPDPPQPVRTAVLLMWVGAGLAVLGVVLTVAQRDALREQLSSQQLPAGTNIDAAVSAALAVAVVIGVIAVSLWVLMAVMNRRGKVWARIVATVLGALNILLNLLAIGGAVGATSLSLVTGVVSLLLAAVIVFLLWRPESSRWFDAMKGPAPSAA